MTHQANLQSTVREVTCWCCREDVIPVIREAVAGPWKFCPSCEVELDGDARPKRPAIGTIAATMALARSTDRQTQAIHAALDFQQKLLASHEQEKAEAERWRLEHEARLDALKRPPSKGNAS